MKRFGKAALVLALLAAAGCAKKEAAPPVDTAGQALKGGNFVVGNWWADWDTDTRTAGSEAEEKLIAYRAKIQKDFDFKFKEKNIAGWDEIQQLAVTSTMAGAPAASIIVLQPNWALALHNQKLLAPINGAKSVDISSSKPVTWNQDVINAFTFDGNAYAFSVSNGGSRHAAGLYFNKRLFSEAGLNPDLLYDLQKSGNWNWDTFMDICKQLTRDTDNDGIIDVYAMPADLSTNILDAVTASNNADLIAKDASGKFVNATGKSEFLQALQFAVRMNDEGIMMPRPEGSNWDWFMSAFTEGKAAMRVDQEYVAQDLQNMADDWGYVLFPKGPNAQDYRFYTDENVMVIPSTYSAEEVDKILYAFQLWNTPVDDDPEAWKDEFYSQYRGSRAVDETLTMIRSAKYGAMRYYSFIPGLNLGDIAWSMWWYEGDPAQLVESVTPSWNTLVDEANGIK